MAGAGAIKQGPWGGNAGVLQDMGTADYISKIIIYYIDAVRAMDVTYVVDGKEEVFHIGGDGGTPKELNLEEYEYVTHISGHFHIKWGEDVFLTQLTLHTNEGQSVSVGDTDQTGAAFSLNLEVGGKVVGFHGLKGFPTEAIEALGVYCLLPV